MTDTADLPPGTQKLFHSWDLTEHGAGVQAVAGWPCMKLEKAGFPVVYLYPVGAPAPGEPLVRVKPLAALGMDPRHPNVFIHRQDPLAHLAEPVP